MNMLTAAGGRENDPSAPHPLDGAFGADWLATQVYPPTEYVVPGLIPEGASILVAAPKIGKSWMVLGIALAAADGGEVFGSIPVKQRPVLYLALEDGQRRLQDRMRKLGAAAPAELLFMIALDRPVDETIMAFLENYAGRKPLVILDTLGRVKGAYGGNDAYGNDYAQLGMLKGLVDAHPGSSLLIVHHTNKGEKTDFLDSVSGTQGIAGAVDSILAIKRDRNAVRSTLHISSRDAREGEYAMDMTDGVWTLVGGSLDAAQGAAERPDSAPDGDLKQRVLRVVNDCPDGVSPSTVAALIPGLEPGGAKQVSNRLAELAKDGKIAWLARGKYGPLPQAEHIPIP